MTRIAQLLLVLAALGLWVASRLPWVDVASSDGLGQPKSTTLNGATWSEALVPLALLLLAAAVAVLAVRGWALRLLGILVAAATLGMGYLGVGLWVVTDVGGRASELAKIPVTALRATQRHYWGAGLVLVAALGARAGAVLLVRSAAKAKANPAATTGKYLAPAARRAAARRDAPEEGMSERMIWDALDEGHDPTVKDNEGR